MPTPTLFCPVCGTENPAARQFCKKCASDLRAPVADPTAPVVAPPAPVPLRPIAIGGGIALVAVVLVIGLLVVLGGSPAASPSASPSPSPTLAAPTASPAPIVTASPAPTAPATAAPTEPPGPTEVPPPAIVSFTGPKDVDCSGPELPFTIHLTWRAANAEGTTLAIDGPGIYKSYPGVLGEDDVPFSCGDEPHTYTLATVGGNGPPVSMRLVIGPRG